MNTLTSALLLDRVGVKLSTPSECLRGGATVKRVERVASKRACCKWPLRGVSFYVKHAIGEAG